MKKKYQIVSKNVLIVGYKIKSHKKLYIILSIVAIIAVLFVLATLILLNIQKKQAEQEYNALLTNLASNMKKCEEVTEYHSSYISTIWYNAIFKKRDSLTDKYTFPEDEYGYGVKMWTDFQTAINNYLLENVEAFEELENQRQNIENDLNKLQSLKNDNSKESLEVITSMYGNLTNLISLSTSPTGNYTEYGEKYNKYKEAFDSEYNKLVLLIPNIKN